MLYSLNTAKKNYFYVDMMFMKLTCVYEITAERIHLYVPFTNSLNKF